MTVALGRGKWPPQTHRLPHPTEEDEGSTEEFSIRTRNLFGPPLPFSPRPTPPPLFWETCIKALGAVPTTVLLKAALCPKMRLESNSRIQDLSARVVRARSTHAHTCINTHTPVPGS